MNLVTCFSSNTSLRSAYKDRDGKALLTALSQQIQTELRNKKRKLLDELDQIKKIGTRSEAKAVEAGMKYGLTDEYVAQAMHKAQAEKEIKRLKVTCESFGVDYENL